MTALSLAAVREAVQAERQRAVEIIELCSAAPELAEGFVRNGTLVSQVERELAKRAPAVPQPRALFDPAALAAAAREGKRLH